MKLLGVKVPQIIADLCRPAQFYLFLSFISVILYVLSMYNIHDTVLKAEPNSEGVHHYTYTGLFLKIVFTILWICILNYICKFKYGLINIINYKLSKLYIIDIFFCNNCYSSFINSFINDKTSAFGLLQFSSEKVNRVRYFKPILLACLIIFLTESTPFL